MSIKYIKYISPNKAKSQQKELYQQIKRDFGMVAEPFLLHSLHYELTASVWAVLRESCLVNRYVNRTITESIATTISSINSCPYCVDAHSIILIGTKNKTIGKAIAENNCEDIENPAVRRIVHWAKKNKELGSETIQTPPFAQIEAPEIIGTAVVFHYINRMVSVLLDESPLPMNGFVKDILKAIVSKITFSKAINRLKKAGDSLTFIRDIQCDDDFYWAKSDDNIHKTFSALKSVVFDLADKYIPTDIQNFLIEAAKDWDGQSMGISRNWVKKYLENFDEKFHPLLNLALLTMFADYQINEKTIQKFKKFDISDEALLSVLAFSSFIVATQIGMKLGQSFTEGKDQ